MIYRLSAKQDWHLIKLIASKLMIVASDSFDIMIKLLFSLHVWCSHKLVLNSFSLLVTSRTSTVDIFHYFFKYWIIHKHEKVFLK